MTEATSAAGAEDYVLRSGVRSGLKREFAFAIKAHAEFTPMSRTRSGKMRGAGGQVGDAGLASCAKRTKNEPSGALDSVAEAAVSPVPSKNDLGNLAGNDVRDEANLAAPVEEAQTLENVVSRTVGDNDGPEYAFPVEEMPCVVLKEAAADSREQQEEAMPEALVGEKLASDDEAVCTIDDREETAEEVPMADVACNQFNSRDEVLVQVPTNAKVALETDVASTTTIRDGMVADDPIEERQSLKCMVAHEFDIQYGTVVGATIEGKLSFGNGAAEGARYQENSTVESSSTAKICDMTTDDGSADVDKFIRIYSRSSFKNRKNRMGHQLPAGIIPLEALDNSWYVEAGEAKGSGIEFENRANETIGATPVVESPYVEVQPKNEKPIFPPKVLDVPIQSKDGLELDSTIVIVDSLEAVNVDKSVTAEKSVRRFTRSLLKPNEEPHLEATEVLSTVTSSGESDGSEEVKGGEVQDVDGPSEPVRTTPKKKMEMKMSKKIALTKFPANVRELLATGLLEGLPVKYVSSGKRQGVLHGVIHGLMIICSCSLCKGSKAVSAYQFELHSGSTKKHPSDFIFLENGSSIRDVLRACISAPLDMLESTILNAIRSETSNQSLTCERCNALFQTSRTGKLSAICDICLVERLTPLHLSQASFAIKKTSSLSAKKTRLTKSAPAPNPPESLSKSMSSQKKSNHGKMTTKDLRLHKLVFMDDTLPDGTEVAYYARGQRLLEGYIKGSGIFCSCCNTVVSPSQFEAHAGWSQRRKPYLNIYTSNGVSLHELSVSLSKGKKFSRESDDLCRICADGGDLLLCDTCPRAFHKECVGLSSIPQEDWYCPCCKSMHEREKYVEHNDNAIAAGRVEGVDPIEAIMQRCIRIVQTPDLDASSCVLCKCHDFSKSGFGPRTVLLCDQCEKEFHIGCLKEHGMADLKELPKGLWFCCSDCCRIHSSLQELLSSGPWLLPDHLMNTMKKKRLEKGLTEESELDVRWRLLNGKMTSPDCRLVLSKAISIFHENFDPIIDLTTKQDLIPAMVYGRELRDQDFGGMYCAVLTVNSSVVSAGILRVLGSDAAELPLVATALESHGYGCFQSLFCCMQTMLNSLKVRRLVLPATKEAEAIWVNKFGFNEITQTQLEEYTKGSRTMIFQGTPVLHKLVSTSHDTVEEQTC